ncbi:MAG TPA: hypothetical protein VFF67_06690 [Thermoplasmata archaeon]|nr:hypothetical protein [Thermoplasmata archaeon]
MREDGMAGDGRRSVARLGVLAALAVSILLCLPPTSAGPAGAATRLVPPYHGAKVSSSPVVARSGCSNLTWRQPLAFNATTGVGVLNVDGRARGCALSWSNAASVYNWASVFVPLHLPAGPHRIIAHWRLVARAAENLTLGRCAGGNASGYWFCDQLALSSLNAYGYVEDLTTGTQRYSTTNWSGFEVRTESLSACMGPIYGCGNYSTGANASVFVNTTVVWSIPVNVTAGHPYSLVMALIYDVGAEIYGRHSHITGGRAVASIDLGAHGDRFALTSIVVR